MEEVLRAIIREEIGKLVFDDSKSGTEFSSAIISGVDSLDELIDSVKSYYHNNIGPLPNAIRVNIKANGEGQVIANNSNLFHDAVERYYWNREFAGRPITEEFIDKVVISVFIGGNEFIIEVHE